MPKSIKTRTKKDDGATSSKVERRSVVYLKRSAGLTHEGRVITAEDIEKGREFSLKLGPAVACVRAGMAKAQGWSVDEAQAELLELHKVKAKER